MTELDADTAPIVDLPRPELATLIDAQSRVAEMLVANVPVDEVLLAIVTALEDVWSASAAAVLLDLGDGERSVVATETVPTAIAEAMVAQASGWLSNEAPGPVVFHVRDETERWPSVANESSGWVKAAAALQIRDDDHTVCTLVVFLSAADPLTDAELAFLRQHGHLVQLTVERHANELLLQRLIAEERSTLAGVLHDDPIQAMTAVGLRLQRLRRHVADDGADLFAEVQASVAGAIERMRRLLIDLHPPTLDDQGLGAALDGWMYELLEPLGITCTLDDQLDDELAIGTASLAYRLSTESLWNVAKHADATAVTVQLDGSNGGVRAVIVDDGVGFDAVRVRRSKAGHMGLSTCRELAARASGHWDVQSEPGRGTTVTFELPGPNPLPG